MPPIVEPDKCFRIGNELHCGELFYEQLKKSPDFQKTAPWPRV